MYMPSLTVSNGGGPAQDMGEDVAAHLPPPADGGIPDREIRACLARLMVKQLPQIDPQTFIASMFLTYPAPPRLAVIPLSGPLDSYRDGMQALPQVLDALASVMSTPAGQVVARSLLPDGFNGLIVLGAAVRIRGSLLGERPTLLGLHVHSGGPADNRAHVIAYDLDSDLMEDMDPGTDRIINALVEKTWSAFNVLDGMVHIALPDDAEQLTRKVLELHPSVTLNSGRVVHAQTIRENLPGDLGSQPGLLAKVPDVRDPDEHERRIAKLVTDTLRPVKRSAPR